MANRPERIGKYQVTDVIGGGGMGTVYKAVDPDLDRTVAIKVIKGDYTGDPEFLRRFRREAQWVANLSQHPNIVVVYELGVENGSPYLVMEYLKGITLDKVIAQRQSFPMFQKVGFVIEVLNALHYAHEHNIVHRDVKPANVMVLKDRHIKLLDFGIARQGDTGQTITGVVMGTWWYIPPEQFNGQTADARSDVFSTGIVLFEVLANTLPFSTADNSYLMQRMRGDPPPPLSKYLQSYPEELDDIIARALALNREQRYRTAEEFAFDLGQVQYQLKRNLASNNIDQARGLIERNELPRACELLSEAIRLDTENQTAKQLLLQLRQALRTDEREGQVKQLRARAIEALSAKQLDIAEKLVREAFNLDPTDPAVLGVLEQVEQAKSRAQQAVLQEAHKHVEEAERAQLRLRANLDDAQAKLKEHNIEGAEALLRLCKAEAPDDFDVLALEIEVEEKKRTVERRRSAGLAEGRPAGKPEPSFSDNRNLDYGAPARSGLSSDGTQPTVLDNGIGLPPPIVPPGAAAAGSLAAKAAESAQFSATHFGAQAAPARESAVMTPPPIKAPTTPKAPEPVAPPWVPPKHAPIPAPELQPPSSKRPLLIVGAALSFVVLAVVLWFLLHRAPTLASVHITGALPGAVYKIGDQRGTIGADGSADIAIAPGKYQLEIALGPDRVSEDVTVAAGRNEFHVPKTPSEQPPQPPPPEKIFAEVTFKSAIPDFDVYDSTTFLGRAHGRSLRRELQEGEHHIRGEKSGYKTFETTVTISSKETQTVSLNLIEDPNAKKAPSQPILTVHTVPNAQVQAGNQSETADSKGEAIFKVPSGLVDIRVTAAGYKAYNSTENVKGDLVLKVPPLEKEQPAPPPPPPASKAASIDYFRANPPSIQEGDSVTLEWSTQNAETVSISSVGTVGQRGSHPLRLVQPTTITLTARGADGKSIAADVTVDVTAKPTVTTKDPPRSSDEDGIKQAHRNFEQLLANGEWGKLTFVEGATLKSISGKFDHVKLTISSCSPPQIESDRATEKCDEVLSLPGAARSGTGNYTLRKSGDTWTVASWIHK